MDLRCTGCGSTQTIEQILREFPLAISCCPERDMQPVAHKVMTPEEYSALNLRGWHFVCKDHDGAGGVAVSYIANQQETGESE